MLNTFATNRALLSTSIYQAIHANVKAFNANDHKMYRDKLLVIKFHHLSKLGGETKSRYMRT